MAVLLSLIFVAQQVCFFPTRSAYAQRGTLIEDLFRTIAEAELEKAQRKRIQKERERQGNERQGNLGKPLGRPIDAKLSDRNPSVTVSVGERSARMTRFISLMQGFSGELKILVTDVQQTSVGSTALRGILPRVFRLSAETEAFCGRCQKFTSYAPLAPQHLSIDAKWRSLSFQLRSVSGFPSSSLRRLEKCDRYLSDIAKLVGSDPQIDRYGLHDKMVIVTTYIQAVLDDLQLCGLSRNQIHSLSHDGRLLRQGLMRQLDLVEQASYEDIIDAYNDFVSKWQPYSGRLHAIGNPFISRRLDRITECCNDVYAVLWTRPPTNSIDLTASAVRLKRECDNLLDELTLRALSPLEYKQRNFVEDGSRDLHDRSQRFYELAERKASQEDLRPVFAQFDSLWQKLRVSYRKLPLVSATIVSRIDQECDHVRRVLGVSTASPPVLFYPALVQAAAAIENESEYLKADLDRLGRFIDPPSLRRPIVNSVNDLHRWAERLHDRLVDRDDLRSLRRETDKLLDTWQKLCRDIDQLRNNALLPSKLRPLQAATESMAPHVAAIAAALSVE